MSNNSAFSLNRGAVKSTSYNRLTRIGMKQYESATRKLSDDIYNGGLDKLIMFL